MSRRSRKKTKHTTKKRIAALTTSLGQVAGGIWFTFSTGGFGSVVGAGLIGSGISSGFKALTGQPKDLTVTSYLQECVIGGATGAFSVGVSAVGSSLLSGGAKAIAQEGIKQTVKRVGGTLVVESIAGAMGQITSRVGRNIAEEKKAFENVGVGDIAVGMVAGGLSSGLGQAMAKGVNKVGSRLLGEAMEETTEQVLSKGRQVLLDTVTGGVAGATGAATATMVRNVVEDKKLLDGVSTAALTGATIGAAVSVGRSVYEQKVSQQQPVVQAETAEITLLVKNANGHGLALINKKLYEISFDPSTQKPIPGRMIDANAYDMTSISLSPDGKIVRWKSNIDNQMYEGSVRGGELRHTAKGEAVGGHFRNSESINTEGLTAEIKSVLPSSTLSQSGQPPIVPNEQMAEIVVNADGKGLVLSKAGKLYEVFVKPGSEHIRYDRLIAANAWDMKDISLNDVRIRWTSEIDGNRYEGVVRQGRLHHNLKGKAVGGHFAESKILNPNHFSTVPSHEVVAQQIGGSAYSHFLNQEELSVIADELKKHVVLVHAVDHQALAMNYYSEDFYAQYGESGYVNEALQCKYSVKKEIQDGVIGHFLNYEAAAFNEEKGMLDRPQTHWAWNQLVQPNSGGDWEHCRMAVLEPLTEIADNDYYAMAPYDTQINHAHRLSQRSVLLLPDSMQTQPPILPNFQGRIVYYDSNKSLRVAIAETLQIQYPHIWPLVDDNGSPCAATIHRSVSGFRPKTILRQANGRSLVLFRHENTQLHPAMAEMRDRGKFIGLHVNSATFLLEVDAKLKQLKEFIDHKNPAVFAKYPQAFISSHRSTRDTLIIKSAHVFYERMLHHHEPVVAMYVLQQAIYADFVSMFYQAGLVGIPSQSEMYLLFSEKTMQQLQGVIAAIYANEATVADYRGLLESRLVLAQQQRDLSCDDIVVSDESKRCGDSLFATVAAQVLMSASDLRATTVAYLVLFKDKYVSQLPPQGFVRIGSGKQALTYNGFEQYCQCIQTPQAWAGIMEAQAIAYALDRPMMIIQPGCNTIPTVFNPAGIHNPIILVCMYQALFASIQPSQPEEKLDVSGLYIALGGQRTQQPASSKKRIFFEAKRKPNAECKEEVYRFDNS